LQGLEEKKKTRLNIKGVMVKNIGVGNAAVSSLPDIMELDLKTIPRDKSLKIENLLT